MRIEVMTWPFGQSNEEPRRILEKSGYEVSYNESGKRLSHDEFAVRAMMADGIVAGTEKYSDRLLAECHNLKVISRVGIGTDNVDLERCDKLGIVVTWTPEAPSDGVAELTIAHILGLLRDTHKADRLIRSGGWNRFTGSLIRNKKIGVLGVGRIGRRVVWLLQSFGADIYGCDLKQDEVSDWVSGCNITWLSIDKLFATCDLVTIHVPLNERNYHLVGMKELMLMKPGSFLVNTSRGPIVDEAIVLGALEPSHYLAGYATDVYDKEPYEGLLTKYNNTILTAHMGSCTKESRYLMEVRAAEDCVRVLQGKEPLRPVPMELRKG